MRIPQGRDKPDPLPPAGLAFYSFGPAASPEQAGSSLLCFREETLGNAWNAFSEAPFLFDPALFLIKNSLFRIWINRNFKDQTILFIPFSGEGAGLYSLFPPLNQKIQKIRQAVYSRTRPVAHSRNHIEPAETAGHLQRTEHVNHPLIIIQRRMVGDTGIRRTGNNDQFPPPCFSNGRRSGFSAFRYGPSAAVYASRSSAKFIVSSAFSFPKTQPKR